MMDEWQNEISNRMKKSKLSLETRGQKKIDSQTRKKGKLKPYQKRLRTL